MVGTEITMAEQVRVEPPTAESPTAGPPTAGPPAAELPQTALPSDETDVQTGDRLFRQERWQEAARYFESAIAQQPAAVPLRCKLGKALLRQSRWDAAEQQFQQALELNAKSHLASYGLAEVAVGREDWATAADRLQRVIALDPGFVARAYLDLGRVLAQLQQWPEAIAACCRAIARNETDESYEQLAALLCAQAREQASE